MKRMEAIATENPDTGVTLVELKGKLDVFSFGELKIWFDELYGAKPTTKVACDISGVTYIASSGWSVLLARRKTALRDSGDLVLVGMDSDIRRVYDSMKIHKLLPCAETVQEASALLLGG